MRRFLAFLVLIGACAASSAFAATTVCSPSVVIGVTTHQWITSLGSNCVFAQSQPAVGDLANVGGGTVLGNATGSSAAPTATITPVLGIAGTSTGTLGLSNSAGGAVTLQGGNGAVTSYTLDLPVAAPVSNGQALTATTGGVGSWSSVITSSFTVTSETANWNVVASADWTRFDNSGASGTVIGTLPTTPTAGDNWCFTVAAAQTFEVLANTGETINFGGVVSASAGNMQSSTVGSVACLYFQSATKAYVEASTGTWVVN